MGQPVVWFEVLGNDRDALVRFYGDLFDWRATPVENWPYSMIDTGAGAGIGGGIGQPPDGSPGHVTFYVQVDDVGSALERVKELGGSPVMGPMGMSDGSTTGLFTDPEGHVIGVHQPPN
jgi:predicted enzyme related to lactoylglutathione lyase